MPLPLVQSLVARKSGRVPGLWGVTNSVVGERYDTGAGKPDVGQSGIIWGVAILLKVNSTPSSRTIVSHGQYVNPYGGWEFRFNLNNYMTWEYYTANSGENQVTSTAVLGKINMSILYVNATVPEPAMHGWVFLNGVRRYQNTSYPGYKPGVPDNGESWFGIPGSTGYVPGVSIIGKLGFRSTAMLPEPAIISLFDAAKLEEDIPSVLPAAMTSAGATIFDRYSVKDNIGKTNIEDSMGGMPLIKSGNPTIAQIASPVWAW